MAVVVFPSLSLTSSSLSSSPPLPCYHPLFLGDEAPPGADPTLPDVDPTIPSMHLVSPIMDQAREALVLVC